GRLGAPKNSEDRVLLRQNAPDGGHGKNLEGLKFPQMQQTHKRIDIRAREINVEDSRGRPRVGKRSQVRGRDDLGAKVGRGVNERPISAKGILRVCCNRDLSLSAWTSFYRTVAEAATVWTATIPLGKTAPGCGAEDFYAHSNTFAADRFTR